MPFEPKKDTESKEFMIGFHVKKDTHIHLKLLGVYREVFMATILVELTNEYLKTQPSQKKIISRLAKNAHKEWDRLCTVMSEKRGWKTGHQLTKKWEVYVTKAKDNLRLRKVSEDIIDIIITELEQLEIDR